jgi:CRP-like cAMP-binding protein
MPRASATSHDAMNMPRTATVTAVTPSVVASCDRETFEEYIRPLFAED